MCIRDRPYSELISLKRFPEIKFCQFGLDCFIINDSTDKDIIAAQNGLKEVSEAIKSNYYDMIILDEICIAIHYDLISIDEVVKVINLRNENTEIIPVSYTHLSAIFYIYNSKGLAMTKMLT